MNWKGPVAAITAERLDEAAEGLRGDSLCVVAPPAENIWPEAMSHLLMKKVIPASITVDDASRR